MRHGAAHFDQLTPEGRTQPGYSRLFNIGAFEPPDFAQSKLVALAQAQLAQHAPTGSDLPAGYTYLGQFVDHDITRMRRSSDKPQETPVPVEELVQQATPELDLDCLYARGWPDRVQIRVDKTSGEFVGPKLEEPHGLLFDLPRTSGNQDGIACIPDPRNDENFLIAQLHVFFMNLHNTVANLLHPVRSDGDDETRFDVDGETRFERAKNMVTWLYQAVIKYDFLQRILTKPAYEHLILDSQYPAFWQVDLNSGLHIPIEFAGAAYRFGHSMVRKSYRLNDTVGAVGFRALFEMTGRGGNTGPNRIRENRVDWTRFFSPPESDVVHNFARPVSCRLAPMLTEMPNEAADNNNLAVRNLLRGKELGLPTAEAIIDFVANSHVAEYAQDLGIDTPISFDEERFAQFSDLVQILTGPSFVGQTPLWTYVLLEPTPDPTGSPPTWMGRLGPLGSVIVAEVFRALLARTGVATDENTGGIEVPANQDQVDDFLSRKRVIPTEGLGPEQRPSEALTMLHLVNLVH
jgi:hypothetical protein